MFDLRRRVFDFHVRKRVCAAGLTDQQRVTLGMITSAFGLRHDTDQPAVRLLCLAGRNTFRDDRRARVASDMNHFGSGVGLLQVVRYSDGIKLAD